LQPIAEWAEIVRANRRPVGSDNPFLQLQEEASKQIIKSLDTFQDIRDRFVETLFLSVYGSAPLQAMVGLRSDAAVAQKRAAREVAREAAQQKMLAELAPRIDQGGLREAAIRALVYIGLGRPQHMVDERGFAVLRQFRANRPEKDRMTLAEFKAILREQFLILLLDQEHAVAALPKLLPQDPTERATASELIREVVSAAAAPTGEMERRLLEIEAIFKAGPAAAPEPGKAEWSVGATQSVRPLARGTKPRPVGTRRNIETHLD
jgi:hypothetical protein